MFIPSATVTYRHFHRRFDTFLQQPKPAKSDPALTSNVQDKSKTRLISTEDNTCGLCGKKSVFQRHNAGQFFFLEACDIRAEKVDRITPGNYRTCNENQFQSITSPLSFPPVPPASLRHSTFPSPSPQYKIENRKSSIQIPPRTAGVSPASLRYSIFLSSTSQQSGDPDPSGFCGSPPPPPPSQI